MRYRTTGRDMSRAAEPLASELRRGGLRAGDDEERVARLSAGRDLERAHVDEAGVVEVGRGDAAVRHVLDLAPDLNDLGREEAIREGEHDAAYVSPNILSKASCTSIYIIAAASH